MLARACRVFILRRSAKREKTKVTVAGVALTQIDSGFFVVNVAAAAAVVVVVVVVAVALLLGAVLAGLAR